MILVFNYKHYQVTMLQISGQVIAFAFLFVLFVAAPWSNLVLVQLFPFGKVEQVDAKIIAIAILDAPLVWTYLG